MGKWAAWLAVGVFGLGLLLVSLLMTSRGAVAPQDSVSVSAPPGTVQVTSPPEYAAPATARSAAAATARPAVRPARGGGALPAKRPALDVLGEREEFRRPTSASGVPRVSPPPSNSPAQEMAKADDAVKPEPHSDHIAFHAEQPMKLYRATQIKVAMGHDTEATRKSVEDPGLDAPRVVDVPHTGELVTARLIAEDGAFEISPSGDQLLKNIDVADCPALWAWFVTPKKPGDHFLRIEVSTLRTVEGRDSYTNVAVPGGTQRVHVVIDGLLPRLAYFNESTAPSLKALMALVPTGLLAAFGKWTWDRIRTRRSGGGGSAQPPETGDPNGVSG